MRLDKSGIKNQNKMFINCQDRNETRTEQYNIMEMWHYMASRPVS
jgi:hypothetical protein